MLSIQHDRNEIMAEKRLSAAPMPTIRVVICQLTVGISMNEYRPHSLTIIKSLSSALRCGNWQRRKVPKKVGVICGCRSIPLSQYGKKNPAQAAADENMEKSTKQELQLPIFHSLFMGLIGMHTRL